MIDEDRLFTQALICAVVVEMWDLGTSPTLLKIEGALRLLYYVTDVDTTPHERAVTTDEVCAMIVDLLAIGALESERITADVPRWGGDEDAETVFPIRLYRGERIADTLELRPGNSCNGFFDYSGPVSEPYLTEIYYVVSEMAFMGVEQMLNLVAVADADWDARYLDESDIDESGFDLAQYTAANWRLNWDEADEGLTDLIDMRVKWKDLLARRPG